MKAHDGQVRHWAPGRAVPRPTELLRAILIVVAQSQKDTKSIRKAVAQWMGFPIKDMSTVYAREGGASYNDSFDQALQHLIDHKMIVRFGKILRIADALKTDYKLVRIPQMGDYKPGASNQRPRKLTFPLDLERLKAEIEGLTLDQLMEYWDAAIAVADVPMGRKWLGREIDGLIASEHIRAEFVRRGVITEDGKLNPDFHWPSTKSGLGDGSMPTPDIPDISPLKLMGYTVGKNGLSARERQKILSEAFIGKIPDAPDVEEWGAPQSKERLKKMAYHLAGLTKFDRRKRNMDMSEAIRMRENDLEFLRVQFYVGRFDGTGGFKYPTT